MLHLRAFILSLFAGSAAVLALVLGAIVLSSCSTLTTPLRDCKSMCAGKVSSYISDGEGERCECRAIEGVKL